MIFCGQCGLQLAPGSTRCPRCGAAVDAQNVSSGELHNDDPTIASSSLLTQQQAQTQQPLILRPGTGTSGNNYRVQTSSQTYAGNPDQATYASSPTQMGNAYTGYSPQTGINAYPPQQQPGYAPGSGSGYPTQQSGYPQNSYPDNTTMGGDNYQSGMAYPTTQQQMPSSYHQEEQSVLNARRRTTGLVLILLGLLLILSAIFLFALQQGYIG